MKNKLTIYCLVLFTLHAPAQDPTPTISAACDEIIKKREYMRAPTRGVVLHVTCRDLSHHFFLLRDDSDTLGVAINSNYKISGGRLKIRSIGPEFFVVKRKFSAEKYQYNFSTDSWSFDKIVPSYWSTGNREGP